MSQRDFAVRFASLHAPAGARRRAAAPQQGRDTQVGTWPEFNKMIGGFFKFHWLYPQLITTKIDDPKSPHHGDVPRPGVRDPRRDLYVRHGHVLAHEPAHPDQHRLRQDERTPTRPRKTIRAPTTTTV